MKQPSTIVILEDDPDRTRELAGCLRERSSGCEVLVFDNAPDMIDWLRLHLEKADLICLDHNLGPNRIRNGETFDPGTGRDVAAYLATRKPVCPIVIHTTNSLAAPGTASSYETCSNPATTNPLASRPNATLGLLRSHAEPYPPDTKRVVPCLAGRVPGGRSRLTTTLGVGQ
jgi:hypothetical protein